MAVLLRSRTGGKRAVKDPVVRVDLRKLALRLKVVEMLRIYAERRRMREAPAIWRRLIRPN